MTIAHPKNVVIIPPSLNPHTKVSTIPKVGHCGIPMELMYVRFVKWGSKSEDQNLENSYLFYILLYCTNDFLYGWVGLVM